MVAFCPAVFDWNNAPDVNRTPSKTQYIGLPLTSNHKMVSYLLISSLTL